MANADELLKVLDIIKAAVIDGELDRRLKQLADSFKQALSDKAGTEISRLNT